jgi:hypothetical protein
MLNQELFLSGVKKLQRNFEFVECKQYYFDIFTALEGKINDKMFIDGCNNILKKTTNGIYSLILVFVLLAGKLFLQSTHSWVHPYFAISKYLSCYPPSHEHLHA